VDRQTRRQIRRTGHAVEFGIICLAGVVTGALAFVFGFVEFLQVNHFLRNSAAVNGLISDKFITYHESNGDTFPDSLPNTPTWSMVRP